MSYNFISIFFYFFFIFNNYFFQCNGSTQLCNKKYNEVAYLTTHNAYNSAEDNFSMPNHNFNISTQLNAGVRGLMIDVYDLFGTPTVYHGTSILGSAPLLNYLNDIKLFLDNNPNEIITIILECYTDANAIENEINQAGLFNYLYSHTNGSAWPTLQSMINNNTRLVIFSDQNDASINQGWYHYVWDHAVETHYTANSTNDFNCDFNRGDSINDLFIFNHFITNSVLGTGDETQAAIANSNPYFINRALQCQQEKNKFPNFITVDFYELGNCFDVVDQLNGIILSIDPQKTNLSELISIYPNPAPSTFTIEIDKRIKPPLHITIINSQGQKMKQLSVEKNRIINVTHALENGLYYVIVEDKKSKVYNQKIIFLTTN